VEFSGRHRLAVSREEAWKALNDPDVLRRAIPGCEEIERLSDTEFQGRVRAQIGPVKAPFTTRVTLEDLEPPSRYTLVGDGQGGTAGFARGRAEVELVAEGAQTELRYVAQFQVGGRLAQIGSRLVDGATRKVAEEFFANLAEILDASPPTPAPAAPSEPTHDAISRRRNGARIAAWAVILVAALVFILWWANT